MNSLARWLWILGFIFVVCYAQDVWSGSYLGPSPCTTEGGCGQGRPLSSATNGIPPFAITHPPGFSGSGGSITLRVCIADSDESLRGPTARAIEKWNGLLAITNNCVGCKVWEEAIPPSSVFHAETAILHELGHCAYGLSHPNRPFDAESPQDGVHQETSFTRSYGNASLANSLEVGADFVRGTRDDFHRAPGGTGAQSVSWFRKSDNNPFAIDSTVIDIDTYSRSVAANLPAGDSWAASGNRRTGETLGIADTHAVMYSLQVEGQEFVGLSADEVNMVKMGMTGVDLKSGTADDYTVELVLLDSPCMDPIDILVGFGPTGGGATGICLIEGIDYSFPQNPNLARHFNIIPQGNSTSFIFLSDSFEWDTDDELVTVFVDGFESGNTSAWSNVVGVTVVSILAH